MFNFNLTSFESDCQPYLADMDAAYCQIVIQLVDARLRCIKTDKLKLQRFNLYHLDQYSDIETRTKILLKLLKSSIGKNNFNEVGFVQPTPPSPTALDTLVFIHGVIAGEDVSIKDVQRTFDLFLRTTDQIDWDWFYQFRFFLAEVQQNEAERVEVREEFEKFIQILDLDYDTFERIKKNEDDSIS